MKNEIKRVTVLGLTFVTLLSAVACGKKQPDQKDYDALPEQYTTQAYGTVEPPTIPVEQIKEEVSDVKIGDLSLKFPFNYKDISSLFTIDWAAYGNNQDKLIDSGSVGFSASYAMLCNGYKMSKNNISMSTFNATDEPVKIDDTQVYKFSISVHNQESYPDLDFKGLHWHSTFTQIEAVLGSPSSEFYNAKTQSTRYSFTDANSIYGIEFDVYDNGGLESITFNDLTRNRVGDKNETTKSNQ